MPSWASYYKGGTPEGTMLSHGVATLSAVIKRENQCFMADLRSFSHLDNVEDIAKTLEYDAAILWVNAEDGETARKLCMALQHVGRKEPLVAVGPAVSLGLRDLRGVGAYIVGEPEFQWKVAVDAAAAGGDVPTEVGSLGSEGMKMDDIPDPDTGIANLEIEKHSPWLPAARTPVYTMSVGRHCPACYGATFIGSWMRCKHCCGDGGVPKYPRRIKSPRRVVDDVYRLSGSHGTGGIGLLAFHDTQFATAQWLRELVGEWVGMVSRIPLYVPLDPAVVAHDPGVVRELAKLGMTWCALDVVHGDDRARASLGVFRPVSDDAAALETVKRNRVNLAARYYVGLPLENDAECGRTEALVRDCAPAHHYGAWWRPVPGTELYDSCVKRGLLSFETHPERLFDAPWLKGIDGPKLYARMKAWPASYSTPAVEMPDIPVTAPAPPKRALVVPNSGIAEVSDHEIHVPPKDVDDGPRGDIRWQIEHILARDTAKILAGWKRPKVTCVIVSFNRPGYIREAFHSLEAQTLPKDQWECVIVESGSTNPGVHEFVNYKDNQVAFPNVKVIRHTEDVNNVATCWNEALAVAAGDYFCMLDDDNRKHPEYFSRLSSHLDAHPEHVAAHCKSQVIDHNGNPRGGRDRVGSFTMQDELSGNFVDSGEVMFRMSAVRELGPFDERCKACEDWDFMCRLKAKWPDGFHFIDERLCDYRAHDMNRMHTSVSLGAEACANLLRSKHAGPKSYFLDVKVVAPAAVDLTQSQRQVISGIEDGLSKIPFVRLPKYGPDDWNADIAIVVAPFRFGGHQVEEIRRRLQSATPRPTVVTLHMEDPQAVIANARFVGIADWMVANDLSAMRWYQTKRAEAKERDGARRTLLWNSLGVSEVALGAVAASEGAERDIDLLVLGYPYPTRADIVKEFLRSAPTSWKVTLVGDGWDRVVAGRSSVRTYPTLDEDASIRIGCRAKVILSTHRRQDDCGGFPVMPPESVHRGFLEAACGAAVVMDDVRKFGDAKMRFVKFSNGADAASKVFELLKDEAKRVAIASHNKRVTLSECTFAYRLTEVLNCVRGQRWSGVIR